jgi:hypothetical protein
MLLYWNFKTVNSVIPFAFGVYKRICAQSGSTSPNNNIIKAISFETMPCNPNTARDYEYIINYKQSRVF